MAIVRILRDGKHVKPLGSQVAISLRAWWQGVATERDQAIVTPLLADLHATSQWLTCDCISGSDLPILAPAQLGRVFFLRRLTQRKSHAENCVFWSAQKEAAELNAGPAKDVPEHPADVAPSFLLSDTAETKSESPGDTLPQMAKRLFWLAEKSGWQRTPLGHSIKDLLQVADGVPVSPEISLKNTLYCTAKVWTHHWADTVFARCTKAGVPLVCWWVQCAISIDLEARTIYFLNEAGQPFSVPVTGELTVFGGDCSSARFPMLVIGALRKRSDGSVHLEKAYAHPVASEKNLMLVDSNLQRQTLADLLSVCLWLYKTKGITVDIKKPLYNGKGATEKPDFVLSISTKGGVESCLIVETMGFDDVQHEARKTDLAKQAGWPVYFDRRYRSTDVSKDLKSAVAKWALPLK